MDYHLFEMTDAKGGFGIVAENSDLIRKKKLNRDDALHRGPFETCITMREHFKQSPNSLEALKKEKQAAKDKAEASKVKTLLKKHKR